MRSNYPKEFFLSMFYYITPLFIIIDYIFGFNVRVSGLQPFGNYKYVYYIFCLGCAFIIYGHEGYSLYVGFIESIVNLVILFVGFLFPYITYTSIIADSNTEEIRFYDSKMIINFMISGLILIVTFQTSVGRITNRLNIY